MNILRYKRLLINYFIFIYSLVNAAKGFLHLKSKCIITKKKKKKLKIQFNALLLNWNLYSRVHPHFQMENFITLSIFLLRLMVLFL